MEKFIINDDVYTGSLSIHNGTTVVPDKEKGDKEQAVGKSGKTKAYKTKSGGRLYLEDSQVTPLA